VSELEASRPHARGMLEPGSSGGRQSPGQRNVLVLCDNDVLHVGTIRDHLNAFKQYSRNHICIADARSADHLGSRLNDFDALVIHYSVPIGKSFLPAPLVDRIRSYNGYKVVFIQDEYRWVNNTVGTIADLGIHAIYSVVNEDAAEAIYHHDCIKQVRRLHTLTGFVPRHLVTAKVPDYERRPIDVGYRARKLPMWLGEAGQEKWLIGEWFKRDAKRHHLVCDIEHDASKRIYGRNWVRFLSNCKAVLGTESAASFIDFSGEVQNAVEAFEATNPLARFEDVQSRFLEGRDGEVVIRVISPRCFEAAALRTLMILYPGRYSGILQEWRHYVRLERDHSNIDEVIAVLRDPKRARDIIENAYRDVALNPRFTFQSMVSSFDEDVAAHTHCSGKIETYEIAHIQRRLKIHYNLARGIIVTTHRVLSQAGHWFVDSVLPEPWRRPVLSRIKLLAAPFRLVR
jgi:hypothetical protein